MNAPLRRQRLQLVLIFAVFLVPIALAFALRQGGWQPQRLRKCPPQGAPNKAEPLERRSPLRQMKNSVS